MPVKRYGKSSTTGGDSNTEPPRRFQSTVLITVVSVAIFVFFSVVSESETFDLRQSIGDVTKKVGNAVSGGNPQKKADDICQAVCIQRKVQREETFFAGANLLDRSELVRRVGWAKDALVSRLKEDYGEYFEKMFVDPETGGYRPLRPATKDGPSAERLRRKLLIKILSVQSKLLTEVDADFHGCGCAGNGTNYQALEGREITLDPMDASVVLEGLLVDDNATTTTPYFLEDYVWATGGHSAAAGHGNLYNESYTAYLERDLRGIFGSIGIRFEGRNYAMGGTSSATIVSMCWKELYGTDVDIFSWDFGMTDGRDMTNQLHYLYRGSLQETRPAHVVVNARNAGSSPKLEAIGLAGFVEDTALKGLLYDAVPDSGETVSVPDREALPSYVRNLKCGGGFEKGEPECGKEKYTTWGCKSRMKQTSWHPGFKVMAMTGHGLALYLTEALLDAVKFLKEHYEEEPDAVALLQRLTEEDKQLHRDFVDAPLPGGHTKLLQLENVTKFDPELDHEFFFRAPTMCHTARLPSRTRYLGLFDNTPDRIAGPAPVGEEAYAVGIEKGAADKTASTDGTVRIEYTNHKERQTGCPGMIVKPDYPDSLYVNGRDDWVTLTFPNEAEQDYYQYVPQDYKGVIILHGKKCSWNKCPGGFVHPVEHYRRPGSTDGLLELTVNGKTVTEMIDVGRGAALARHEGGFRFEPNAAGQYELAFKVHGEKNFLELADVVLM